MHNFLSTSQWYQCFGVLRVPATAGQHVVKLPRARSLIHTLSGPPVAVPGQGAGGIGSYSCMRNAR